MPSQVVEDTVEVKEGPDTKYHISAKWVVYHNGESVGWCRTKEAAEKVAKEIRERLSKKLSYSKSEMKRISILEDSEDGQ